MVHKVVRSMRWAESDEWEGCTIACWWGYVLYSHIFNRYCTQSINIFLVHQYRLGAVSTKLRWSDILLRTTQFIRTSVYSIIHNRPQILKSCGASVGGQIHVASHGTHSAVESINLAAKEETFCFAVGGVSFRCRPRQQRGSSTSARLCHDFTGPRTSRENWIWQPVTYCYRPCQSLVAGRVKDGIVWWCHPIRINARVCHPSMYCIVRIPLIVENLKTTYQLDTDLLPRG